MRILSNACGAGKGGKCAASVFILLAFIILVAQGPAISLEAVEVIAPGQENRNCGTCAYMDAQMDRIRKGLDPDYGPGVVPQGFFDSYIDAVKTAGGSSDGSVAAASGRVSSLDSPWLWPSLVNGSYTMNTVSASRTDADGDGLRECRYSYNLTGLAAAGYSASEITDLTAETEKAFAHWNEALAYVGLEFRQVTDGTQHIVVGTAAYGSGTTGQASLFGAFFEFGSASYLNYSYNYTHFGSHYHYVEEANTLYDRPPGNPYTSLLKRYGHLDSDNVGEVERYSTIYGTAIHEIGHLMGLNHTFNSIAAAATNQSTDYSVDWLAHDINVAYSAMPKVTTIDGEDMVAGLWYRGLNNSFMTYDEPGTALWLGLTPQIKGYVALIYRDAKGDGRVKAAELLALAKAERDKYTTFRHSNIKHEAENNNTAGTAQALTIGQSVLGAISNWATTTYTDASDQVDTSSGTDADWYSVSLTSGTTYYFDMDVGSTGMSTALYVYTPSNTTTAAASSVPTGSDWFTSTEQDPGSVSDVKFDGGYVYYNSLRDPFITYTATATGTHYLQVTKNSNSSSSAGDYFLRTSTAKVTTAPTLAVVSSGNDLNFSWNAVSGASEYWLRAAVKGTTNYTYYKGIGTATAYSLSKPTETYEYSVVALNNQNENDSAFTWSTAVSNNASSYDLTVTISPQGVIDAGAQWAIDGGTTWRNSGTSVSVVEGASVTITFKQVRGWTRNSYSDTGTMPAQNTTVAESYTARTDGYTLAVAILPAEAVTAGAKWQIVSPSEAGTTARDSATGVTIYDGEAYEISFSSVTGWTTPANQTGTMSTGNVNLTGTYVQKTHGLTVTISPAGAVTDGAQWSLDGGTTWNASAATVQVAEGVAYTVTFKDLTTAPWNRPAAQTGTMSTSDVSITGTYTANQAPIVTLTAPGASGATANTSYSVKWTDDDDDAGTTISFYLDTDTTWSEANADGSQTLLKSGISLASDGDADLSDRLDLSSVASGTPANGSHPLSSVANGAYYLLAVADDGRNSVVRTWSTGKLTVNHAGSIGGIRVSNLTDSSAVITWTTDVTGIGQVGYGTTTALGTTTADARGVNLKVHRVELTGLTASTAYRYDLRVTLETTYDGIGYFHDNSGSATYTFTTAASAAKGTSHTVTGKAVKKDDSTVIQNAVVAVKAVKASGSPARVVGEAPGETLLEEGVVTKAGRAVFATASTESTYVSALTDGSGDFTVDLADLKDPSDGTPFVYASGDSLVVEGFGGDAGTFSGSGQVSATAATAVGSLEFVTEITQSFALAKGFNLISVPLTLGTATDNSTYSAYDLLDAVTSLVAIYRYAPDTGYQAAFNTGTKSGTDFDIEAGRGYWLKLTEDGKTLQLTGKIISAPQAMSLAKGFNLIGFTSASGYPGSIKITSYTPGTLLTSIKDGTTVTSVAIYAWVDGGYSLTYYNSVDGSTALAGKAFDIELTKGYFIKMSQTTAFTPSN